jgi:hypothetical protein
VLAYGAGILQDRPMHSVSRQPSTPFAIGDECLCAAIRKNSNRKNNPRPLQAGD